MELQTCETQNLVETPLKADSKLFGEPPLKVLAFAGAELESSQYSIFVG